MIDLANYHDLTVTAEASSGCYTDWEGMTDDTDRDRMVALVRDAAVAVGFADDETVCDLTLHWVHANVEMADWPDPDVVVEVLVAFHELLASRYWMKSGVVWGPRVA